MVTSERLYKKKFFEVSLEEVLQSKTTGLQPWNRTAKKEQIFKSRGAICANHSGYFKNLKN